jgi:hypothetical protein
MRQEGVPVTTAAFVATAPAEVLRAVFRPDVGDPSLPLLEERVTSWQAAAQELVRAWEGTFVAVVRAAGGSAARLLALILAHFPTFRDVAIYDGRPGAYAGTPP